MTVHVSYKGRHVVTGEAQKSNLMFWHAIKVDPKLIDIEGVVTRLVEIRNEDRVNFEAYTGSDGWIRFNFPPAYDVNETEVLL